MNTRHRRQHEFKEVMDLGIYRLVDNYEDNFTAANENNEESILKLQYGYNGGIGTPTQDRMFNMASRHRL